MMDKTYEQYEKECEEIRKVNGELIKIFENELKEKGLVKKTIKNHIENIDLYINDYLLREDALPMENGLTKLDSFFYFFIHKCMWSTPPSCKAMGASIKKFYRCMMEHGKIDKSDYELLSQDIKEMMPFWVEECDDFNDW